MVYNDVVNGVNLMDDRAISILNLLVENPVIAILIVIALILLFCLFLSSKGNIHINVTGRGDIHADTNVVTHSNATGQKTSSGHWAIKVLISLLIIIVSGIVVLIFRDAARDDTKTDAGNSPKVTESGISPAVSITPKTALQQPESHVFVDAAMEKYIRKALGVSSTAIVNQSDLANVKEIDATGDGQITWLSDLTHCTNLELLELENNKVSDLSPLAELKHLRLLGLRNNRLTDASLQYLSRLYTLTDLSISGNGITNINYLSGLVNLKNLYLNGNKISDFSPLYGLSDLRELYVDKNAMDASGQHSTLSSKLPLCDILLRKKG